MRIILITDLGHPHHVWNNPSPTAILVENIWSAYATSRTKFGTNTFQKGGPIWSNNLIASDTEYLIGNPEKLITEKGYVLEPKSPESAALMMAETAYGVIDKHKDDSYSDIPLANRPEAAIHFPNDGSEDKPGDSRLLFRERIKMLLCLAVYYSACALIDILQRLDIPQDNTNERVNEDLKYIAKDVPAYAYVPHTLPAYVDEIIASKKKVVQKKITDFSNTNSQASLMLALGALAPILALSIIPALAANAAKREIIPTDSRIPAEG